MLLSLDAVRAGDQAGRVRGVMEIMSVLSAAGVRRDLLHDAGQAGVLASGGHRARGSGDVVDEALGRLAERSLLTFSLDGQAVIAHRLVLRVVRDAAGPARAAGGGVPGRRLGAGRARGGACRVTGPRWPSGTFPSR